MHIIVLHNSSLECGNHFILPYTVEFRELPVLTLNHFFSHQMFLPNAKPAITRRDSCTDHWRRTYQEGIGNLQIMVSCCDHNQQREFQIMQQSLDYMQVLPDILKVLSNCTCTFRLENIFTTGTFHIIKDLILVYRWWEIFSIRPFEN